MMFTVIYIHHILLHLNAFIKRCYEDDMLCIYLVCLHILLQDQKCKYFSFSNWYIERWCLVYQIIGKRKTCKCKPTRYWVSTKGCQVAFFIPMLTVVSNSLNPILSTSFAFAGYLNIFYNRLYCWEDNAALSTSCNFKLFALQDIYIISFVYIFKCII